MKKLYIIGGTMGVGKTTVCKLLKKELNNSVFLDGDWCWDSHPFQVNDETKKIVLDNIRYLLNNFLHSDSFENIIFCWVMDHEEIIDSILKFLDTSNCEVKIISLIASPDVLSERIRKDIENGIRQDSQIENSIKRLSLYDSVSSIKIDTSALTPIEVTKIIKEL